MKQYKRKNYKKLGEKCPLTQGQANKIWENPSFPIQGASAILINTLWFTSFYAALIPLGMVFSLACLISEYWIFKVFHFKKKYILKFFLQYTLLRKTTVLDELGNDLTEDMTDFLEFSFVIFSVKNCYFF